MHQRNSSMIQLLGKLAGGACSHKGTEEGIVLVKHDLLVPFHYQLCRAQSCSTCGTVPSINSETFVLNIGHQMLPDAVQRWSTLP